MRTARYHDYVLLKVIMFIALVGLGIFVYMNFVKPVEHVAADTAWVVVKPTCTADGERYKVCEDCGDKFDVHTIPATGHKPATPTKENEKKHTLTVGASYDSVVYCSACNIELSREKVWVDSNHDVEIIETHEKVIDATCTKNGSYELVKTCKGCEKEVERTLVKVDALGHDYSWSAVYENGSFKLIGTCSRDTHKETITANNNSTFKAEIDKTVATCCLVRYNVTATFNGVDLCENVDFEADKNHTVEYFRDHDSYVNNKPSYLILPDMLYDEETDTYYYDISTPGIEPVGAGTYSDWDKYGFCLAKFVCYECREIGCTAEKCPESYVHYVFIYSAEYDTRIPEEPQPI